MVGLVQDNAHVDVCCGQREHLVWPVPMQRRHSLKINHCNNQQIYYIKRRRIVHKNIEFANVGQLFDSDRLHFEQGGAVEQLVSWFDLHHYRLKQQLQRLRVKPLKKKKLAMLNDHGRKHIIIINTF